MKRLDVYLNNQLIGKLWQDERGLGFRYFNAYLSQAVLLPLSRHLPLPAEGSDHIFTDLECRAFFENLLPEGDVRRQLARALGLSTGNTFALLEAIGGDCAGAVSVLPAGMVPARSGRKRPISKDDLATELENLPIHPLLADEEGVRLSLAGAQNKLPVCFDGENYFIPVAGEPSTHIIKTPIANLENTVVNEAFCMNLARLMGLNVPHVRVADISGRSHYLIERYDRTITAAGSLCRLHQEDFCQALGIPPEQKYEKEGGPSLQACFELVREWSSEPLLDVMAMLRWTLFNLLIGNADAHGKNVAFLYTDAGVRLAPFYDLISTAVYERINNKFAMRLGGEKDPRYLLPHHLGRFAEEVGIGLRVVNAELHDFRNQLLSQAQKLASEYRAKPENKMIINRLLLILEQRAMKADSLLP